MRIILSLLVIMLLGSCQPDTNKNTNKSAPANWSGPRDSASEFRGRLQEMERAASEKKSDTLGRLVATIDFNVMTYDSLIRKEEVISMIELDSPDIKHLLHKDETVIKDERVTLIIDYPMKNPDLSELVSKTGFTRLSLINAIAKRYHEIYNEEELSATTKTIPPGKRTGLINRNETNGKYHIWGHDIGDLVLTSIWVYKNDSGKIYLRLQIDS